MNLKQLTARAGMAIALAVTPVTLLASPAGAETQNGRIENCDGGLVLLHSVGNSVWATAGDAKWQLIGITATISGTYYDKKTAQLVPFGPNPFDKTWAKGNQTVDETCSATHVFTDPDTQAQVTVVFVATYRQVQ